MIENRFIRYNTYERYLEDLNAGNISEDSIVFVRDKRLIHTNNTDYFAAGDFELLDDLVTSIDTGLTAEGNFIKKISAPTITSEKMGDTHYLITIECDTEDATIVYTTDETEPNAYDNGNIYYYPFTLVVESDNSVVIKAIAVKGGYLNSDITEYTIENNIE